MDYALEHGRDFIGKPAAQLPTPALVVSLPVLQRNVETLLRDVDQLGIQFRPHVKTLKTLEVTRMMLAGGKHRKIIASTLAEIRGALPLVKEGLLDECLYGLPVCPGYIPQLASLRKSVRITLLVDNEQQISHLERFAAAEPWGVFVKLDVGSRRAGVAADSDALRSLVERAEQSPSVRVEGFYCHAGHSYNSRTQADVEGLLELEVRSLLNAVSLLPPDRKPVASFGATPTAHVVRSIKALVPDNVTLELHAGNFPCNDLQQVSTGVVGFEDQSVQIAAEVCSVYPERNEALLNAGAIALSRETGGAFDGFGRIAGKPDWKILRLSQEHGIVGTEAQGQAVGDNFAVGQRVNIYANHICITAAAFHCFFVVDEHDIVKDIWIPWKGW